MTRQSVMPLVLTFLRERANLEHSTQEIASELDISVNSVSSSCLRMSRKPDSPIQAGSSAGLYLYSTTRARPNPDKPELYEFVGLTKAGDRIIRDEKGILWRIAGEL